MPELDDNPFKRALEAREGGEFTRLRPFRPPEAKGASPRRIDQTRTVADLNLADPAVVSKNPRIAGLTVHDLGDLADQFSGIPVYNPKIADLTIDDMQDLEGVFLEFKTNAAREISGLARGELAAVDVSCCCCTPCCCCAAAEVEPIRA
jgi:hypothetical protein